MISKAIALTKSDNKRSAALYELQRQITQAEKDANDAKVNRCHINKLPTEMLSDIFLYVSKVEEFSTTHLLLSSVCTLWRSIIMTHPRFWSDLKLPQRHVPNIINLWMKCSSSRIEQLSFSRLTPELAIRAASMLRLLKEPPKTLMLHEDHIVPLLKCRDQVSFFSSLRRLELEMDTLIEFDKSLPSVLEINTPGALDTFTSSLEHLRISHKIVSPEQIPRFRPKRLEIHLTSSFPSRCIQQILELQNTERLEALSVWCVSTLEPKANNTIIELPSLKELDFKFLLHTSYIDLLSSLRIPRLSSVCLREISKSIETYTKSITPPETLFNIERLTLTQCLTTYPLVLADHILQMDKLTHLDLSYMRTPVSVIVDAIAGTVGTGPKCLSLAHLNVMATICSAESCVRLVRSRNRNGVDGVDNTTSLKYINMDYCPDLDAGLVKYLEAKVPYFTAIPPRLSKHNGCRV